MREQLPPGIYHLPSRRLRAVVQLPLDPTTGKRPQISHTFDDVAEAVAWRNIARAAVRKGEPLPEPAKLKVQTTGAYKPFREVADLWYEQYARQARRSGNVPTTALSKRRALDKHVNPRFGNALLSGITADDVDALCDSLETSGLSPQTVNAVLWMVKEVLEYGRAHGWVGDNVAAATLRRSQKRRTPRQEVYVSWENTLNLAALLRPEFRLALWIQRACGLRVSEVWGLHLGDWEPDTHTLQVRRMGGKTFEEWAPDGKVATTSEVERLKTPAGRRVVGVPQLVADYMDDYIAQFHPAPEPNQRLMVSPHGANSSATYQTSMRNRATQLGLQSSTGRAVTTHALRKSFSIDLEVGPVPGLVRSYLMGHARSPVNGEAAVTVGVYGRRTAHEGEIAAAAEQVQALMVADGVTNLDMSSADVPGVDWIPQAEAASRLGVSDNTIYVYARQGRLERRLHRAPGSAVAHPFVHVRDVERLEVRGAGQVSLAQCARILGLHRSTVKRWLRHLDVAIKQGGEGNTQAWISPEDFMTFRAAVEQMRAFTDGHVSVRQAAALLGTEHHQVYKRMQLGELNTYSPPPCGYGGANTVWLSKVEVQALAGQVPRRRGPRDEPDAQFLTVADAAVLLKRSSATVREWCNLGILPTTRAAGVGGQSQVWIRQGDVEQLVGKDMSAVVRTARPGQD